MSASLWTAAAPLVLASRSPTRRAMLEAAGIPVEPVAAAVDERAAEDRLRAGGADAAAIAVGLAAAKALAGAALRPGRLVLGADQTLALGGTLLHKPAGRDDAVRQVLRLAGRTHTLQSGAALARDGDILWSTATVATLWMRRLDERAARRYVEVAGDGVLGSVGAYQLEALGAHLFERVEGDHFTILGLPLLPLLAELRRLGMLDP
jgi:septum formation protein